MSDTSTRQAGEWKRPVPLVGDTTSARERSKDPAGWAFDPASVTAFDEVLAARRDVRRFRPDPLPEHILTEILAAGHAGPSVGHSQSWRFIVVRDADTRERAAVLADACRTRQAAKLDEEARRKLLDLQLSGVREAPVGVVVCCDRRARSAGVLGRDTFTDADVWSCACAIENMWLAARARGVGMGWVTLFQPQDLLGLVGAPDGVETLGWLCFGWPDERHPNPGLERVGWSTKKPLDDVIMAERWDNTAPATADRLATTVNPADVVAARDRADTLLTPPGSLGVLDQAIGTIERCLGTQPPRFRAVVAVADHKVADLGVTAYSRDVTREVHAACQVGASLSARLADETDIPLDVIDCGTSDGDLATTNPLTDEQLGTLIGDGLTWGRQHGNHAVVALGELGMGNTTVAAALAAWWLDAPTDEVVGLGASADSGIVRRKREVVASALTRMPAHPAGRDALRTLGGPEIAYLSGVVRGTTEAGGVILLDGLVTTMAACVAVAENPGVASRLVAAQASSETVHRRVLDSLGLEPLLDLRLRAGEGVGALLAADMLRTSMIARATMARTAPVDGR